MSEFTFDGLGPDDASSEHPDGIRLQKVLARAGYGSRRVCEELIVAGKVRVNGERAILGRRVRPGLDVVEVNGRFVGLAPDLVYYLLNKPAGVITTASDPQGRVIITDLVPASPRVFPVGRLDAETEGLIILTNDGELSQFLTHPSHGIEKEYLVMLEGSPSDRDISRIRRGIELEDGPTAPAKVALLGPGTVRMTIHEGRNRQVRRVFEAIGFDVIRLVRTRIGPIRDQRLHPGEWRELTADEIISLRESG